MTLVGALGSTEDIGVLLRDYKGNMRLGSVSMVWELIRIYLAVVSTLPPMKSISAANEEHLPPMKSICRQ